MADSTGADALSAAWGRLLDALALAACAVVLAMTLMICADVLLRNVRLLQMDAADLRFADNSFDIVYAPYLISVVPDPVKVAREMRRVCKPGGRIIILNHFLSANPVVSRVERFISPLTIHIGFKSDLDLPGFLAQAELQPVSIEKVNIPPIWSLVTCIKD